VWPPFVLVAGLLLIGQAAAADGLFEAVGTRVACMPLSPRALLIALLGLVALVTALLNLDTSVVFPPRSCSTQLADAASTSGRSCTGRCSYPTPPRCCCPDRT
jgi:hypothetical protein